MIHLITSVSAPIRVIRDTAKAYLRRLQKTERGASQIVKVDRDAPHVLQADEGEKLVQLELLANCADSISQRGGFHVHFVCPTDSELLILRVMRRIGEGKLSPDCLKTVVLHRRLEMPDTYRRSVHGYEERVLRADPTGEFVDLWPEGFFDARVPELF